MNKNAFAAVMVGACAVLVPCTPALAQEWLPGAEITGHSIQVETNGVVNTIYFEPGGVARIMTPGGTQIAARWSAANQSLCLETGANIQECFPYRSAFQTGQAVTLTSSCQAVSRWVPNSTEPNAPAESMRKGERG